jgi:alkaline phosphatase
MEMPQFRPWRCTLHGTFLILAFVFLFPLIAWSGQAKYIFLFIGDGMGISQRSAAQEYAGRDLLMNTFPAQGVTATHSADRFITGSAAAGTAIACGQKTNTGYVGMDPEQQDVMSVAELAKEQGKKVGIISSVSIDHATAASFYAHVHFRGQYYDIAVALAESGFDYFAGGGLKALENNTGNSLEYKSNAWDLIRDSGYSIVRSRQEFEELKPGAGKVMAINPKLRNGQTLPYAMDQREQDISLAEFTAKGIELLDNEDGFFIMVEGGKIDWACHANDGAAAVHDILAFEQALHKAYTFYEQHPEETLILVTGDHECGGMSLGSAKTGYETNFGLLSSQKVSSQKFARDIIPELKEQEQSFEQIKQVITQMFGLTFQGDPDNSLYLKPHEEEKIEKAFERSMAGKEDENENAYLPYSGSDSLTVTLTRILNHKAGIGWTSYTHTGVPVITSAVGSGSEMFNGSYDNTEIGLRIMEIMGCSSKVHSTQTGENRNALGKALALAPH